MDKDFWVIMYEYKRYFQSTDNLYLVETTYDRYIKNFNTSQDAIENVHRRFYDVQINDIHNFSKVLREYITSSPKIVKITQENSPIFFNQPTSTVEMTFFLDTIKGRILSNNYDEIKKMYQQGNQVPLEIRVF